MDVLVPLIFGVIVSGLIGYLIGNLKKRGPEGAALSALLGPLGWLIAALLPFEAGSAEERSKQSAYLPKEDPFERWQKEQNGPAPLRVRPAPTTGGEEAEKLERLREIHAQGLITNEEYAAKRRQILDAM